MLYGLIGKSLIHSISPSIHKLLGNNDYELCELEEQDLELFFKKREFKGINVTIPYKVKVMQYLDEIDERALRIGCVNTIINQDGRLIGYNTDYDGFKELVESLNIEVKNKKVIVLGSGGTSKTVSTVLADLGAASIKIVSRTKSENTLTYEEALLEKDTQIIVNTTPIGQYPDTAKYPISIFDFDKLEGLIDVIYNPLKTRLVCFAKKRKIKAAGGLKMLVSQAIYAHQLFFNKEVDYEIKKSVYNNIYKSMLNIVLIGMPGCGKSTIAKYLSSLLNKEILDLDIEIERQEKDQIKNIFAEKGEEYFRNLETKITRYFSRKHGLIISTGGGIVKNKANIEMLRQNGLIIFINRDLSLLEALASDKRPLARTKEDLEKLYKERHYLYLKSADIVVANNDKFIKCAYQIKEGFDEINDY